VADAKFKAQLGEAATQDTLSIVTLKAYEPNELTYECQTGKGGVVVFSEIYYPGWTATVDGDPVEVGRVNYILRALRIEPGKHEIVLTFKPKSVKATETVAYMSFALLIGVLFGAALIEYRRRKKE